MFTINATKEQLDLVVQQLFEHFPEERIFCFYGEMGSGKTTLIKKICQYLGVQNITSSPTFAIVNEYHSTQNQKIYHFDFYRIEELSEAEDIGFYDYLYSGNYCFIEWTEKIEELLDCNYIHIDIDCIDDNTRTFTVKLVN